MGEVRTKAIIANPLTGEKLELDALVDTGAVMPLIGRDIASKLALATVRRAIVTLADDSSQEMDVVGPVRFEIGDRIAHTDCLVGPDLVEPLIGQVLLESLDLIVDCPRKQLLPRPESPAYPSYKLK